MTAEAPERIWADKKLERTVAGSRIGTHWDRKGGFAKVEYVRADLHATLRAERDALREKHLETLTALRMAYLALKAFSDSDSDRKRFADMIAEVDAERAALDATKDQSP